jgi:peptidoglycan/xylan/chitin deacetylase (PgdA/CDA1 family)
MGAPLLTFDDGPSESTAEILDLLGGYGVRATFFVPAMYAIVSRDGRILEEPPLASLRLRCALRASA